MDRPQPARARLDRGLNLLSAAEPLLARCTFPNPGTAVDCAVSGGPDSSALAVLAVAAGLDVTLHHVDHGLRPTSADDALVVEALAGLLDVSWRAHRVVVAPGANLEARCRDARKSVLPPGAMTGHTADDQAETMVLNLIWGAGLDGLAGMSPGRRHPILALRRIETHRLCAELGLDVVIDETNDDPAFRRNRIRHELLPLLDDIGGRDVVAVMARQAGLIRDEATLLDSLAAEIDALDAKDLAAAPPVLARRALRQLISGATGEPGPDLATVERALAVARGDAVATDLGGGWRLRRSKQRLIVEPPD